MAMEAFGNTVQGKTTRMYVTTKEMLVELMFNHMKREQRYDHLTTAQRGLTKMTEPNSS